MPREKITENVERFCRENEVVRAVCIRNLPEENRIREPKYEEETTTEEHPETKQHTTDTTNDA